MKNQTTYTVGFAKEYASDLLANITLETLWRKAIVYTLVILSAYVGYQGWQSFGIFGKIVAVIAPFLIVTFSSNLSFVGVIGLLLFGTLDYSANFTGAYDAYSDLATDYEAAKLRESLIAEPIAQESPVDRIDSQYDTKVSDAKALYAERIAALRTQIQTNRQSAMRLIAEAEPLDHDGRTDNDGYVKELRVEAERLRTLNSDLEIEVETLEADQIVAVAAINAERIDAVTQANAAHVAAVTQAGITHAEKVASAKLTTLTEQQSLTPVQKVLTQLPPSFTVKIGSWNLNCNTQFVVVGLLAMAITFGPSLLNLSLSRKLKVVGHEEVTEMRKARKDLVALTGDYSTLEENLESAHRVAELAKIRHDSAERQLASVSAEKESLEAVVDETSEELQTLRKELAIAVASLNEATNQLSIANGTVDELQSINAELEAESESANRNLELVQSQLELAVDEQQGLLERLSTSSIVHWTPQERYREAHRLARGGTEAVEEFLEVYSFDYELPVDFDDKSYSKRRDLMLSLVPQVAKHQGELLRGDFAVTTV